MNTTRSTNISAGIKTTLLLGGLSGLLVAGGALIGGPSAAAIGLAIALATNLGAWFFSDKMALKASGAQPLEESEAPQIYSMTRELCATAELPMPRLYVIPQAQPNAFATGRNPEHAAVAVTAGIVQHLSKAELRGVIAHELAHIKNRDTLIQSVAAAIGGAITYLGYMFIFFGGRGNNSPLGAIGALAMILLAPMAAGIIQMAISRQREFSADATGAEFCRDPLALASALNRLHEGGQANPMKVNEATECMYIVKPFSGQRVAGLFSTHPPIEDRVERLRTLQVSGR